MGRCNCDLPACVLPLIVKTAVVLDSRSKKCTIFGLRKLMHFPKMSSIFIVYKPGNCTANEGGTHEQDTIRGIYYSLDEAKDKGQILLNQETFDWWAVHNSIPSGDMWARYNRLPTWEIIKVPLEKSVCCELGEDVVGFITVSTSKLETNARYNEYKIQFDENFDISKRDQRELVLHRTQSS